MYYLQNQLKKLHQDFWSVPTEQHLVRATKYLEVLIGIFLMVARSGYQLSNIVRTSKVLSRLTLNLLNENSARKMAGPGKVFHSCPAENTDMTDDNFVAFDKAMWVNGS